MDTNPNGANLAEVVLTTVGSILSLLGGVFILSCYIILPQRRHFRHSLIINLAISDFINALNNTSSGLYILISRHDIYPGTGCVANGFIGQLSVQATDCSILLIALVTLVNIRKTTFLSDSSTITKILLCLTAWVLPMITSFTALGLGIYVPVDGNWCWIEEQPKYMRYVLTHMWRFLVIFLSSAIYIYIYYYLRKRFRNLRMGGVSTSQGSAVIPSSTRRRGHGGHEKLADNELQDTEPIVKKHFEGVEGKLSQASHADIYGREPGAGMKPRLVTTVHAPTAMDKQLRSTERRIQKMLLLNGYPIAYIILWIPGIANRIAEATGHQVVVLGIMQASTQLVGLANAITYGLNENMVRQLRDHFTQGGNSAAAERKVMGQMA